MASISRSHLSVELVKARAGDREAQTQVAEFVYAQLLPSFEAKAYGYIDREEVGSLVDEALVTKAFDPGRSYNERGHAAGWLKTLIDRHISDARRSIDRDKLRRLARGHQVGGQSAANWAEHQAMFNEMHSQLRTFVRSKLSRKQRDVLGSCAHGNKATATAERLGIARQTVNKVKRVVVSKLQRYLMATYPEYAERYAERLSLKPIDSEEGP